jgi:hypothetical protein
MNPGPPHHPTNPNVPRNRLVQQGPRRSSQERWSCVCEYAADRWLVTEGAVGSAVIVEVHPGLQCSGAVVAGLVNRDVCPLALQALDEPLGFAVRLRDGEGGCGCA